MDNIKPITVIATVLVIIATSGRCSADLTRSLLIKSRCNSKVPVNYTAMTGFMNQSVVGNQASLCSRHWWHRIVYHHPNWCKLAEQNPSSGNPILMWLLLSYASIKNFLCFPQSIWTEVFLEPFEFDVILTIKVRIGILCTWYNMVGQWAGSCYSRLTHMSID